MAKGSGKRAMRRRAADVSAAARDDAEQLKRATTRRLAKLEKDLAAARAMEERHRSRLAAASAEADRIRMEIAGLVRHATEPAVGGAKKVGHAAGGLLEDAADVVADAAGAVMSAAGSVVGAARRTVRPKPAVKKVPAPAKTAGRKAPGRAKPAGAAAPTEAKPVEAEPAAEAPAPVKPATPRTRRARPAAPPATGPDNA